MPAVAPAAQPAAPAADPAPVITPPLQDKALWVGLIGPVVAVGVSKLNQKFALGLDPMALTVFVAGLFASAVAYIYSHIKARTAKGLASIASASKGFARLGLMLALTIGLAGCAYLKSLGGREVDCLQHDGSALVAQLLPALLGQNWAQAVSDLASSDEAVCALEAIAAPPVVGVGAGGGGGSVQPEARIKAQCWLEAHGVKVKGP